MALAEHKPCHAERRACAEIRESMLTFDYTGVLLFFEEVTKMFQNYGNDEKRSYRDCRRERLLG
jgi:hypothetical protein